MPSLRMIRLINNLENNRINATQLQTFLTDPNKLNEFSELLKRRS